MKVRDVQQPPHLPNGSPYRHLSVVVVGCGSIGQRHIRNLGVLGVENIRGVDPDESRLVACGVAPASSMMSALQDGADAVFICTPPSMHADQAIEALNCGAHVFVEKPLAHTLSDLNRLLEAARASARLVQVGYNLRHIEVLKSLRDRLLGGEWGRPLWARFEVGQYLPDWRPAQDYRRSYTASRDLGGGIILDASHEIDLALWMLGRPSELCCMAGKTSDLEMEVEDTATLLVRFESGAQADIHLDCVQRKYSRGFKIACERETVEWAFPQNEILLTADPPEKWSVPGTYDPNRMYVTEAREFLDLVLAGATSNSLEEGKRTLQVALAAKAAAEDRRWVVLDL